MIKNKKYFPIIILASLVLMVVAIIFTASWVQGKNNSAGLADNLKLHVSKESIINYQLKQSSSGDKFILYNYVSSKEIGPIVFNGFTEDMSKRTSNSQVFLKSVESVNDKLQKENYVAKFYAKPVFQKQGSKWYQIEIATTSVEAFVQQTRLTALDHFQQLVGQEVFAESLYSSTLAGDGYITDRSYVGWYVVHGEPQGYSGDYTSTTISVGSGHDSIYFVTRAFLPFDTSSLSSGVNIISAILRIYVSIPGSTFNSSNDGLDYLNIVETTQPSTNSLPLVDFDLCGAVDNPTLGATAVDITGMDGPVDFTLNSTGLSWIKKSGEASSCGGGTGVTCLGLREGHDIENNGAAADADLLTTLIFSSSETADILLKPHLIIEYSSLVPKVKIIDGSLKIKNGKVFIR